MEAGLLCCSPNVGQFTVKSPNVLFNLEVAQENRTWNFKIRLLSNQRAEMQLERYAWARLGKPNIDNIGGWFVNEIGRERCIERYNLFQKLLNQEQTEPLPQIEFGLHDHLQNIFLENESKAKESFEAIPKCIQTVIFYRTYRIMKDHFDNSKMGNHSMPDHPDFGRHSYFQSKELDRQYHLKTAERIALLTELIDNLELF